MLFVGFTNSCDEQSSPPTGNHRHAIWELSIEPAKELVISSSLGLQMSNQRLKHLWLERIKGEPEVAADKAALATRSCCARPTLVTAPGAVVASS